MSEQHAEKVRVVELVYGDEVVVRTSCGHDNPVWWVDSRVWNEVITGDQDAEGPGIFCPACFIAAAERFYAGSCWRITGWQLVPDFARRHIDGVES